jgi:hypothetical protein
MSLPAATDAELESFLASFQHPIGETAAQLVATLRRLRPELVPRVRLGWRSVNFRHPAAGFVCAVFPMPEHVSLVFEHGRLLSNESGLLEGEGKQIRFVRIAPGRPVPEEALGLLLAEAIALRC